MRDGSAWRCARLVDVATLVMGQAPPSYYVRREGRGYPFLQGSADFGPLHPQIDVYCSRPSRSCRAGDLLISVRAPVGDLNLADRDYAIGRGLAAIRFNGLKPRLGKHLLMRAAPTLRRIAQGSTFDAIGSETLGQLELSFPSSDDEQQRIAEILDALDDQIAAIERTIMKKRLVEASLVAQVWHEAQASESWRVRPLDELASIEAGLTLGVEPSGPSSVMLPYLRVANVQNGYIDTAEMKTVRVLRSQIERYAVQTGDVLLTEGGDFDKLGRGAMWDGRIAPCLHQNHIFRVRCRRALILPDFFAMHIASPAGRRYFLSVAKQTTNLASINSTQLKAMPVPVPSVEEQERLLQPVRAARRELTYEEAELRKLRMLQEGLMYDVLSGRVRVTRWGELTG